MYLKVDEKIARITPPNIVDPSAGWGLGAPTIGAVENQCIT